MMTELPWLDMLGWVGFAGLGAFYWLLGSGKVLQAYIFSMIGAGAWLAVGIAIEFGHMAVLPSLIAMELMVILVNIRGIIKWRDEGRLARHQQHQDDLKELLRKKYPLLDGGTPLPEGVEGGKSYYITTYGQYIAHDDVELEKPAGEIDLSREYRHPDDDFGG